MKDTELEALLKRHYRGFAPTRFPGADQQRYAGLVRSTIREALDSSGRPVAVLDFGCGRGAVDIYDFRSENVRVCGVDVDSSVLGNPLLDEAKLCNEALDYADDTFDVICSSHVFEHLDSPWESMAELYRVLKPGGKLIALTPNCRSLPALAARITPRRLHVWLNAKRGRAERDTFPTVYRLNTKRAVRAAAEKVGFKIEMIEYWEGRPEYFFFTRFTFCIGLCWEKAVTSLPFLGWLRSSLFVVLSK